MEKLEYLQKLNPYLPYDLGVISGDSYDTDDRLEYIGIMNYQHSSDENSRSKDFSITEIAFSDNNIVTRLGVIKRKVKPVLRPLPDLYKEIDGEVGIVELAKIAVQWDWKLGKYRDINDSFIDVAEFYSSTFFYNEKYKYFQLDSSCEQPYVAFNQLDLFTYLFSHHYDVWDLHSKGLCIYKNEI